MCDTKLNAFSIWSLGWETVGRSEILVTNIINMNSGTVSDCKCDGSITSWEEEIFSVH